MFIGNKIANKKDKAIPQPLSRLKIKARWGFPFVPFPARPLGIPLHRRSTQHL
jgi:hypothetical protein